jgi:hypothetical protein
MDRRDISRILVGSAAGAALLSSRAQAQSCTAPCYPQTPSESAASITPTNYAYEPGWFDRYGTNTTPGTTLVNSAVQAAFRSGHQVRGHVGVEYYCGTATIEVPAGARANLYGVKLSTDVVNAPFLDITGNDVVILGAEIEGHGNSALTSAAEVLVRFVGSSVASYRSDLLLQDCHIHHGGFYGVFCEFAENVLIAGCRFAAIQYTAVAGTTVNRMRVNNNTIHDIGPGDSGQCYGLFFSRREGTNNLVTHPRPKDCQASSNTIYNIPTWEALDAHAGERIVFSNNTIHGCRLGINVSRDSDGYPPLNVVVADNIIDIGSVSNPYRAIGSGGTFGSGKEAKNIVVKGNVVRGYGLDSNEDGAIMFQYTDGLIIEGNIVENSRGVAVCILQENNDFMASNNVIRGVQSGVGNAAGISIRNTTQTGHVADNYIDASAEIGVFIGNSNPGVSFGNNRIVTSGTRYSSALYGGAGLEMEGSTTIDVASIAIGAQAQFAITVAGAELGDYVAGVTCNVSTAPLSLTGTVTAQDTVTVVLQNNSGGAVNPLSATYTALVRKR